MRFTASPRPCAAGCFPGTRWKPEPGAEALTKAPGPRNNELDSVVTDGHPMQPAAFRSMETNPARLTGLYAEQFRLSAVKPGETIAIVSDLGTRRSYIEAAFAAASELGADIY